MSCADLYRPCKATCASKLLSPPAAVQLADIFTLRPAGAERQGLTAPPLKSWQTSGRTH
jgi:hypothetical protein